MIIRKAEYKTSVVSLDKIIKDDVPEFAFVGRSNVGKSSLINFLTGRNGLAKASSTPGKTRMINYFDINDSFRFVDLPGYGFAKVGKSQFDVWESTLSQYLIESPSLVMIFLLLDIRHAPSLQDRQMLEYLLFHRLPFSIIATKADKLSKAAIGRQIEMLAKELKLRKEIFLPCSSITGLGKDKILDLIESKLEEK